MYIAELKITDDSFVELLFGKTKDGLNRGPAKGIKEMYMHEFHLLNKHCSARLGSAINQKAFFMSTGKFLSDSTRLSLCVSVCKCVCVCVFLCVNDMRSRSFTRMKIGLRTAAAAWRCLP